MERFWIYGLFPENNMRPGVKKVNGGQFIIKHPDNWEATFYYWKSGSKRGKDLRYNVTLPNNGMLVYSGETVDEIKKWCRKNLDMIAEKCDKDDMIRAERRFAELVREARERERFFISHQEG